MSAPAPPLLRLGVLVSGGGRSLENLAERSKSGDLAAEVACVICDRDSAFALTRAERLGIPSTVISPKQFPDPAEFGDAVFRYLEEQRVGLAVLAGYLVKLPMVERWLGRVMNIHPALLPSFGGRGFYGDRVHEAVIAAGVKVTGCTVHFVDNEYDRGPIILQRTVPVRFDDSADDIAERVFEQEKEAYPDAINRYARGHIEIVDGRVRERD